MPLVHSRKAPPSLRPPQADAEAFWGAVSGAAGRPPGDIRQAQLLAQGDALDRTRSPPLPLFLFLRRSPGFRRLPGCRDVGHVPVSGGCTCAGNGREQRRLLVIGPRGGTALPLAALLGALLIPRMRSDRGHGLHCGLQLSPCSARLGGPLGCDWDVGDGARPRGRRVDRLSCRLVVAARQDDVVVFVSWRGGHG